MARDKLFKGVNRKKFFEKPTFKAFYNLLDNYEHETGVAEVVTEEEKKENWEFINLICETPCIQYVHNYLRAKHLVAPLIEDFKKELYNLWFTLYARTEGGPKDSSGFEHVFIGEVKQGGVIGFHNWIQFFLEEKKGNVDYKGYIVNKKAHKHEVSNDEHLITIQFSWGHEVKMVSSTFVGTSPEFEMALYTLCFFVGAENNEIYVGPYHVNMKVYKWHLPGGDKMGACFPMAL